MQLTDRLFVSLLEAAPDAMVCVRGDGRIALVNAEAERLFGYRRADLDGQPVEILIPDGARAAHVAHRAAYMADPKPRPMRAMLELSGRRRDGSTFPAEISLSAADTEEGILVMAAVRDVTERLDLQAERERLASLADRDRLDRQLQQSQRLESLGQLAGGVAHDFNNLLAVISNYAAFVGDEVARSPREVNWQAVRDDVAQIRQATERAAGLTRQLLAFARREVIQPRPLNLNQVIECTRQMLVRALGENVELHTELAADLCTVFADPGQVEQMLVNLAVNARDAMPSGGTLTLSTSTTHVDAAHSASQAGLRVGQYACLKVSDTGEGMTKEVIDRAFEPFFTTKAKGEGTGLGLATVYGIVTQAGGCVQICSEVGTGTTFMVLLPAVGDGAEPDLPPRPSARDSAGETILVVEDESAMREVTRRILSRNGYRVLVAADGREAVEVAAAGQPGSIDLLLTDVVMPQMMGKEAAEKISVLQPGVKVLFMSGYTQGLLDTQGVIRPGINLIEKPFTETSLLTKLRQVAAADAEPEPEAPVG